jgi:hypothetical protein
LMSTFEIGRRFVFIIYNIRTYKMVADKVKEEWISAMCRDHPKLPRFVVEELAETYALDDGEWLRENKKKGEKFARKQAKKGKKLVSQAEEDPDRFKIVGAIEVERASEEKQAKTPTIEFEGESEFEIVETSNAASSE